MARNATSAMQRVFALQVFTSVQSKWGKGIVESSEIAAELVGFTAQTIHSVGRAHSIYME